MTASRLIVTCGVPSEGENVYCDGISKLTITTLRAGWLELRAFNEESNSEGAVNHFLQLRRTLRCSPKREGPQDRG